MKIGRSMIEISQRQVRLFEKYWKVSSYIRKLIAQGEHQQQDFKFEISDSKKIARTLVAFSNTGGGKLLVGVKDNGAIAGVRSDEEFYMIEAAAQLYCRPQVAYQMKEWNIDGKILLEVDIPRDRTNGPFSAPDKEGRWMVYIRVNDQNLLANRVLLNVWKLQKRANGITLRYTDKEKILLNYLEDHPDVTLSKFKRIAGINQRVAEKVLVDLIVLNIIKMDITEKSVLYRLHPQMAETKKGVS
jgi:predicted HTH transcriptional regulator